MRWTASLNRKTLTRSIIWTLALSTAGVSAGSWSATTATSHTTTAVALSVSSDPPGAAVYVDGQFVGETPFDLLALSAGDHRVRVVKDGYLEHSRVVKIGGSKTATLQVRLTRRAEQNPATRTAGLRIVVIAGEDAVNIIQQKTAVAPVVEVRDRNDQPVAGAMVRFAIQGGRATFSGARTLTVTTNVAGRAAVSGLTPTASGAVQISASAAFQGQTAVVAIAQTNVMTAAEAAAVAGAGGTSGGGTAAGGGAAAGGGGGLSLTIIGLVGGAVAGGTLAAKEVFGGGGTKYTGTYSGQMLEVFSTCARNHTANGTVAIELDDPTSDTVSGSATVKGTFVGIGSTCPNDPFATRTQDFDSTDSVTGTKGALAFRVSHSNSVSNPAGSVYTATFTFSGALVGAEITGTLTFDGVTTGPQAAPIGLSRSVYPVTLRKQ